VSSELEINMRWCIVGMIARDLDLMRGGKRYIKTAAYGHFGRDDPDFTWEKVKKLEA